MIYTYIFLLLIVCYLMLIKPLITNRRYNNANYLSNLRLINSFFNKIYSFEDYITSVQKEKIKTHYYDLGKYFKGKTDYYKKEGSVKRFNDIFLNFDNYIADYNKNYVKTQKHRLSQFFDNIEGKKLDDQQRTAIVTDDYSNLIIAGAGSGKTLTILGKVKYLIEVKKTKPEDILLLSFTSKTVEELNVRLENMGLGTRARTFHKLGYDTIKKYHKKTPAVTNENTLRNVIKSYLKNDIFSDKMALEAYVTYIACYMNIPEGHESYDSLGAKFDVEKGIDFQTLKDKCETEKLNKVEKASLDTMQGEKVKSVEELNIANFLYLNGIEYEYERPYPFGNVMYQPDFYLSDYDIYLEHFGIDQNNRAKHFSTLNESKYLEEMDLKREKHKLNNTKLLETYSYYSRDRVLIEKLQLMLQNENVVFKPRDTEEIYSKVNSNNDNFGKEMVELISAFINLCKSNKLNPDQITKKFLGKTNFSSKYMLERQQIFMKFTISILKKYDDFLKERDEIDFNDMINMAADLINANNSEYNYKYIIVDEYQDISQSRFNLIKVIRNLSNARLICVGDDWQSIYRFAGSDISLFSNFENHVGEYKKLFIEKTYRYSQLLVDITSKFILKNKNQIEKSPRSVKEPLLNPIKLVYYSPDNAESVLINQIEKIIEKNGNKSILVLGRHSFDINGFIKLKTDSKIKFNERNNKLEIRGYEDVDIKYITVHKSKGLEADNVILLNLKNDLIGFPNKMTDDPILSVLLSHNEWFSFSEERRLFYVALTRTRNQVILLVPAKPSLFVEELIRDNDDLFITNKELLSEIKCPYCQTGNLVKRKNLLKNNEFLGCSNYPSCNQTFNNLEILENNILCGRCESGFMIRRKGGKGNFFGCTNYPKCKNTINLERYTGKK